MPGFNIAVISAEQARLEQHPIYGALRAPADLQVFMTHHVFSVWDFMSLIKTLQGQVAPVRVPWVPTAHADTRYFINQLCLEEESDELPAADGSTPRYASHFESYCDAMDEIGARGDLAREFVAAVARDGLQLALARPEVPEPSRRFTTQTFAFIDSGKPHVVAAALALGREKIIPVMFRQLLDDMAITPHQAPAFHYYLNRHIHLDGDFHGPLSLRLVESLCDGSAERLAEAEQAAVTALQARYAFWDGVLAAIEAHRLTRSAA